MLRSWTSAVPGAGVASGSATDDFEREKSITTSEVRSRCEGLMAVDSSIRPAAPSSTGPHMVVNWRGTSAAGSVGGRQLRNRDDDPAGTDGQRLQPRELDTQLPDAQFQVEAGRARSSTAVARGARRRPYRRAAVGDAPRRRPCTGASEAPVVMPLPIASITRTAATRISRGRSGERAEWRCGSAYTPPDKAWGSVGR